MRKKVETIHNIMAPVEKVWSQISKGSDVNSWLPVIKTCQLQGNGEGAKRVCSTEQGDIYETILKVDHQSKIFQYAIEKQPLLPISDIVGTMKIWGDENETQLEWVLEFEIANETQYDMVKEAVSGMYAAGASGLETISNK